MSNAVKAVLALCLVASVAACSRAPVEATGAVAAVPQAPLSIEPVYTGKYK